MTEPKQAVRVHLTNVAGAGATQLITSLLPALERDASVRVSEIHLPDRGTLATYRSHEHGVRVTTYQRRVFNSLSRLLECTALAHRLDGTSPILVLGDLPLRCNAPQTVFVQTPHLAAHAPSHSVRDALKFAIARWVFRRNARFAKAFIVQTPVMAAALVEHYPVIADRIHVIAQPVPSWLLDSGLVRRGRKGPADAKLSLVYPAAMYPHKNHRLLADIDARSANAWPIDNLTLTLRPDQTPTPAVPWLRCSGFLSSSAMIEIYRRCDALLFLSIAESYGFPLVEAMFVGLPIVCPDLPYARTLCGDNAIYFDPQSVESLRSAISMLHERLQGGWWPDWSGQLASIPSDWNMVARAMLAVAVTHGATAADRFS